MISELLNKNNKFGLEKNSFAWNYISLGIAFAEYVDFNKDYKLYLSLVVPFRKYITGLISLGLLIHRLSKKCRRSRRKKKNYWKSFY